MVMGLFTEGRESKERGHKKILSRVIPTEYPTFVPQDFSPKSGCGENILEPWRLKILISASQVPATPPPKKKPPPAAYKLSMLPGFWSMRKETAVAMMWEAKLWVQVRYLPKSIFSFVAKNKNWYWCWCWPFQEGTNTSIWNNSTLKLLWKG